MTKLHSSTPRAFEKISNYGNIYYDVHTKFKED